MRNIQWGKLLVSVALPFVAGGIGAYFTDPQIPTWYQELTKPTLSPPNFVFGPVWTLLYIMMGVSLYFVWTKRTKLDKKLPYLFFGMQMVLNSLWSVIFFGRQDPVTALAVIIAMWILIALTAFYFYRISKTSSYLLIPYLLWVSFATYLNYMIVALN